MRRAFEELEPYRPLDARLASVDRRLKHLALGREPQPVVDELGIARHQLVLEMRGPAVERQLLDAAVGKVEDRPARRLIHSAALHSDEAILDQIEPADAVALAEGVEPLD